MTKHYYMADLFEYTSWKWCIRSRRHVLSFPYSVITLSFLFVHSFSSFFPFPFLFPFNSLGDSNTYFVWHLFFVPCVKSQLYLYTLSLLCYQREREYFYSIIKHVFICSSILLSLHTLSIFLWKNFHSRLKSKLWLFVLLFSIWTLMSFQNILGGKSNSMNFALGKYSYIILVWKVHNFLRESAVKT